MQRRTPLIALSPERPRISQRESAGCFHRLVCPGSTRYRELCSLALEALRECCGHAGSFKVRNLPALHQPSDENNVNLEPQAPTP